MGFRSTPTPATVAVYRGSKMTVTEWTTVFDAESYARVAVTTNADLAVVRDSAGIMRFAVDNTGRSWSVDEGRHTATVAEWGHSGPVTA